MDKEKHIIIGYIDLDENLRDSIIKFFATTEWKFNREQCSVRVGVITK